MELAPIEGKSVRFPPGRVEIRLDESYRYAYQQLYARYQSNLAGLPVLRERDFDRRAVRVTPAQLDALNAALAKSSRSGPAHPTSVFAAQEAAKTRLFKKLQYLS
jgi:hypothetical protein